MPTLEELKDDLAELKKLYDISEKSRVQQFLALEIRRVETMIMEKDQKDCKSPTDVSAKATTAKPLMCTSKITTYGWDQSDKFVKIYVSLPNIHKIEPSQVKVQFHTKSFELNVSELGDKNYILLITNLLHPINPETSQYKIKSDSIVVMLKKSKVNHWACITESEQKSKEKKMPKLDNSDDPSKGLMDIMRQMYEEGDDETKRTIAKAWSESRSKVMTDPGF